MPGNLSRFPGMFYSLHQYPHMPAASPEYLEKHPLQPKNIEFRGILRIFAH